ncbi:radical SAM protein [Sesbania bispinosa]|nr:radical SAM protein [Sesbania bispinosa]
MKRHCQLPLSLQSTKHSRPRSAIARCTVCHKAWLSVTTTLCSSSAAVHEALPLQSTKHYCLSLLSMKDHCCRCTIRTLPLPVTPTTTRHSPPCLATIAPSQADWRLARSSSPHRVVVECGKE